MGSQQKVNQNKYLFNNMVSRCHKPRIDSDAACRGFNPRTEQLFVWNKGSCSGTGCLCLSLSRFVNTLTVQELFLFLVWQRHKKKRKQRTQY